MSDQTSDKKTTITRIRAQRFRVHAHVRYRVEDDEAWHDGTTQNVSRSGVLLRGDSYLEPETPIELIVDLPAVLADEPRGEVVCHGRVVRIEAFDASEAVFAAEFSSYQFRKNS